MLQRENVVDQLKILLNKQGKSSQIVKIPSILGNKLNLI